MSVFHVPSARARRRATPLAAFAAVASLVGTAAAAPVDATGVTVPRAEAAAADSRPTKVVVIVVDALRKDFIKKYRMTNIQALMQGGVRFPNSYLGHMGSETVVTHNVITSGLLPQHMGWTDEGYRDVADVLDPGDVEPNDFYLPGDMTKEQIWALQAEAGYPKLQDYLHAADDSKVVATVSPKRYAAWTFGGEDVDITVTFGSRLTCTNPTSAKFRVPDGVNVPEYIHDPATECSASNLDDPPGRYSVDGDKTHVYDTDNFPARLYPLDGNRYTIGHDPAHLGGDVWAADVAMDIMDHEDWSGIFVTLPGVDKAAHMWGAEDDPGAENFGNGDPMTHLAAATKVADYQVGRIVQHLRDSGDLDDTLVVVTADHGMNAGRMNFLGDTHDVAAGFPNDARGYYNWYYADAATDFDYLDPSAWIQPLVDTGNVGISFQDSAIRLWLKDNSATKKAEAAGIVSDLRGVMATFVRRGQRFELHSRMAKRRLTTAEWEWFDLRGQEIVDTSAAAYGADVIGLLRDHTVAGVVGDHGGAQYAAQNIPIFFYGAGTTPSRRSGAIRSVDILPTILRALGATPTADMDGRSFRLR